MSHHRNNRSVTVQHVILICFSLPAQGIVPADYKADLEKRLADLMIVGGRSSLSRHKLCVYELECHFHVKIAMVHLEGPTDSLGEHMERYGAVELDNKSLAPFLYARES